MADVPGRAPLPSRGRRTPKGEDMRPTTRLIAMAALAVLVLAGATQAGETFKQVLPENGMTVILEENHSSPVVNLRFYVKAGGIYEGEYLGCGISHFCEHLVANGPTTNRTAEDTRLATDPVIPRSCVNRSGTHIMIS